MATLVGYPLCLGANPRNEEGKMSAESWVSVDAVAKHLSVAKDSMY